MRTRHVVALSMLAGLALGAGAFQSLHAEDAYVRKVPLDAYTVPVPMPVPPGSSLDPAATAGSDPGDLITGYTPPTREPGTPTIGLSIKSPFDDRK